MNAQSLISRSTESTTDLMASSGANTLCLFLYNRRQGEQGVKFLYSSGMDQATRHNYSSGVWNYDPFLSRVNTLRDRPGATEVLARGAVESGRDRRLGYWDFIENVGYRDIYACLHKFSDEVYLVGGLMQRVKGRGERALRGSSAEQGLGDFVSGSANELMQSLLSGARLPLPQQPSALIEDLSQREQEVVSGLQQGFSNKQIAANLGLSTYTVENHLKRIYRKLGVNNRTALLASVTL